MIRRAFIVCQTTASVFPACREETEIIGAPDSMQEADFLVDTFGVAVSCSQRPRVDVATDAVAEIQNTLHQGCGARFAGQCP